MLTLLSNSYFNPIILNIEYKPWLLGLIYLSLYSIIKNNESIYYHRILFTQSACFDLSKRNKAQSTRFIMKQKTTLLLLAMLISFCGFSQSLESYSIEQLNKMKTEAIQNENFEEAQKIKLEIESRKSVNDLIADTKKAMDAAATNEEYTKAAELKTKLAQLEQIKSLEQQIADAAASENFEQAQKLKVQKQQLWDEINNQHSETTAVVEVSANPANTEGSSTLHFTNYLNNKLNASGANYFDVIVDNKYVGTINKYYELEVSNLSPGKHEVVLVPSVFASKLKKTKTYNIKSSFIASANKSYVLSFKDFNKNKDFIKVWTKNQNSTNHEEIFSNSESAIPETTNPVVSNDIENPEFEKNNPFHADIQYSKISTNLTTWAKSELPEDRESGFRYNWDVDFTAPIIKNTGAIFTIGVGQTAYSYEWYSGYDDYTNSIESFSNTLHAGLGYQLEPSPYVTLQTQLRVNVSWNMYSSYIWAPSSVIGTTTFYSPNDISEDTFPVTGSYHLSGLFFFNEKQNFGLVTDLNVAFGSGGTSTSFSIGVAFANIKSPSQQYRKYKGETLKY